MEVYILDSNYEKLGLIDNAESVLWNKKLIEVGECELYVPADNEHINLIVNGKYIYREDDEMLCEIISVELETNVEQGDYIIVTGHDMKSVLSGRVVATELTYSGSVANFIKKVIVDNVINPQQTQRAINNFTFNDSNFNEFTETINTNVSNEDILELIKTTCLTYNYGFKVKYTNDSKTLEFGLIKGENKANITSETYIEFSPTYSNIISSKYKEDVSNYKNLCYISYKDLNEKVQLMSVFNTPVEPVGEDRKEIYVDGSSTNREITFEELQSMYPDVTLSGSSYKSNGVVVANVSEDKIVVTDATYLLLIKTIALNTLALHNKQVAFEGEVDSINSYTYKVDYDLGDIVKVINEYGIEAQAMITEVLESDDNEQGYIVTPKFEYI